MNTTGTILSMFGGVLLLGISFLVYEIRRCHGGEVLSGLMVVLRPADCAPEELEAALREVRERFRGMNLSADVQFFLCDEGCDGEEAAMLRVVSEREKMVLLPAQDIAQALQCWSAGSTAGR